MLHLTCFCFFFSAHPFFSLKSFWKFHQFDCGYIITKRETFLLCNIYSVCTSTSVFKVRDYWYFQASKTVCRSCVRSFLLWAESYLSSFLCIGCVWYTAVQHKKGGGWYQNFDMHQEGERRVHRREVYERENHFITTRGA